MRPEIGSWYCQWCTQLSTAWPLHAKASSLSKIRRGPHSHIIHTAQGVSRVRHLKLHHRGTWTPGPRARALDPPRLAARPMSQKGTLQRDPSQIESQKMSEYGPIFRETRQSTQAPTQSTAHHVFDSLVSGMRDAVARPEINTNTIKALRWCTHTEGHARARVPYDPPLSTGGSATNVHAVQSRP